MLFHIIQNVKFEYFIDAETAAEALQVSTLEDADDKHESWIISALEDDEEKDFDDEE
jgi:hypothetical protein